jgi:hypothetical protein
MIAAPSLRFSETLGYETVFLISAPHPLLILKLRLTLRSGARVKFLVSLFRDVEPDLTELRD